MDHHMMTRRRLLQVSASGLVTTTILGGALTAPTAAEAKPYASPFTWISPRGTIEVMDDYPYWVAKEMGYFGDLGVETAMEPGPSDGTAVVKFLAVEQADIGFPSPGVLSFAINNGMDLVSVFGSGFLDLFNIAFRKGEGMADLKGLEGKTVLLGSAAWQAIADPMFAAVGVDPKKITYVEAGWPTWTTALAGGRAMPAWHGRACVPIWGPRGWTSTTGSGCAARPCRPIRWWCDGRIWKTRNGWSS